MTGKVILFIFLSVAAVYGQSPYGWRDLDTVTTGGANDLNPQADHTNSSFPYAEPLTDSWVVFESWSGDSSAIVGARYLGQGLCRDPKIYLISPHKTGVTQKLPDICSVTYEIRVGNLYQWRTFTVAAWEEKSDSVWNIHYSFCDSTGENWSVPQAVTDDSISNENPKVRPLTDTSLVIVWKKGPTLRYSIATFNGVSNPKELVSCASDTFDFDFYYYRYGSQTDLAWTQKGQDGNNYCMIGRTSGADPTAISAMDSILLCGSIEHPRFRLAYTPVLTFDLRNNGRYEAWMSVYGSGQWYSSLIAGDTSSSNLHLDFLSPPEPVAAQKRAEALLPFRPWGFSLWEHQTQTDTSLVFSNPDTIAGIGFDRNPQMSTSVQYCPGGLATGFAVFESNRTGTTHIYSRHFVYSLGAVNEELPYASDFRLFQNYPNPFNPATAISYRLSAVSHVTLTVFDVLGRAVTTLVSSRQTPGEHTVTFDGRGLASGVYFYQLRAGNRVISRKMLLVK